MSRKKKLGRDKFHLKDWMKSNLPLFARECPDDASLKEAHEWWGKRAEATLEPELATQVSGLLAAGAVAEASTNNPHFAKTFIELGSTMIGIEL